MDLSIAVPESRRCHARAREFQAMAQSLRVQSSREQMLRAAAAFERMAQDAEAREITEGLVHLRARVVKRSASAA